MSAHTLGQGDDSRENQDPPFRALRQADIEQTRQAPENGQQGRKSGQGNGHERAIAGAARNEGKGDPESPGQEQAEAEQEAAQEGGADRPVGPAGAVQAPQEDTQPDHEGRPEVEWRHGQGGQAARQHQIEAMPPAPPRGQPGSRTHDR